MRRTVRLWAQDGPMCPVSSSAEDRFWCRITMINRLHQEVIGAP